MEKQEFIKLELNNIDKIESPIIINDTTYTIDNLKKFLENEDNYIFVSTINNKVIAFIYGYSLNKPDGKNMFYIHSVDVLPEYQGNGIGTKLMDYAIEFIKNEKKYYKFWVLCDTNNLRACNLYKKYGNEIDQKLYYRNF